VLNWPFGIGYGDLGQTIRSFISHISREYQTINHLIPLDLRSGRGIVRGQSQAFSARSGKPVNKCKLFLLTLFVVLLCGTGCAVWPEPGPTTSWLKRPGFFPSPINNQTVQLDIAILERNLGDPFLNHELWQNTDEMIVDLDCKAAVENNGFRVGQIVGMTPGKLLDLLKSKRYCSNPRTRLLASGNTVPLYLSPVLPRSDFMVQLGKEPHEEALDQARFCLDVKATLTADNKTRLNFTPKVEHGEPMLPFHPDPAEQRWIMRVEKPCKTYAELAWDVVLAPGEFLIIGAILPKERTLGHRSFVQEDGQPVQRLLVLRTNRAPQGGDSSEPTLEDLARNHPSPCLAVQASMTQIRARGE